MTHHRSYIVAEIPDPVRSQIQALRDSLNTLTARLPVEITLAGSSGVGPIPIGTDLSLISTTSTEHFLAFRHSARASLPFALFRTRPSSIWSHSTVRHLIIFIRSCASLAFHFPPSSGLTIHTAHCVVEHH